MRLIYEEHHEPALGRFKDAFVQDNVAQTIYVYDSQGQYLLIDATGLDALVPQHLSISGSTVTLSGGGGSISLPTPAAQTLSISGNTLSLSGGNSVTLPGADTSTFVPNTRTVAGKPLSSNVTLVPGDISGLQAVLDSKGTSNFSGAYVDLTGKPTLFSGAYADLTGKPTLFSGSFTDLTNKPAATSYLPSSGENGQILGFQGGVPVWGYSSNLVSQATTTSPGIIQLAGALGGTATAPTVDYTGLINKPTLGALAALDTVTLTTNVTGTLPVTNGGTGLSTLTSGQILAAASSTTITTLATTGSGNVVRATSPTLVTPVLGTPSSVTLTNATGLPISTGVTGLATNMAAFLATPSSANLRGTVTDETGTGTLVFNTSPTLVTPALGTPTALVLTNATGLPIAGISATGTPSATTYLRGDGTWATPTGGGGGSTITVQDEGTTLSSAATLFNFVGAGVTATNTGDQITVTIGAGTGFANPMTTAGDIIYGGSGGAATRLATGTGFLRGGTTPSYSAIGLASSDVTGTLAPANGGTGVTSLGTGVGTFLSTPSSANLLAAVTDETGTGSLVFATSPTLVTPTLGVATVTTLNKVTITPPTTNATLTLVQGSTLATGSAFSITLNTTANATVTVPTSGQLATQAGSETFTNKRITKRNGTLTVSSNTYTPTGDSQDLSIIASPTAAYTIVNPSGTPTQGQELFLRIVTGATSYAITWGAIYAASQGTTLPAILPASSTTNFKFIYDSTLAKWVLEATDLPVYNPIQVRAYRRVTAATTVTALDGVVSVDASGAAVAVTLPDPTTVGGQAFTIKKWDTTANAVSFVGTVDGSTTYSLTTTNRPSVTVVSNGTSYEVI